MKKVKYLLKSHFENISIIFNVAKFEYIISSRNTRLGIIWNFLNPTIQILLYTIIFGMGIRGSTRGDFPYIVWALSGIVPWLLISKTLSMSSKSIIANKNWASKTTVPISIFPTIYALQEFFTFLVTLLLTYLVLLGFGYLNLNLWLHIYYLICIFVFCITISSFVGVICALIPDIRYLIAHIIRLTFWFSPVIWDISNLGKNIYLILQINPVMYLLNGFRYSITGIQLPNYFPNYDVYFWVVIIIILGISAKLHHTYKEGEYDR